MPTFVPSEEEFWRDSPAASEIFAYRNAHATSTTEAWGFDRGGVSDNRESTYAEFSCVAVSGYGRDRLMIQASRMKDGRWEITHTVQLGK
jgi:hypothetical protein